MKEPLKAGDRVAVYGSSQTAGYEACSTAPTLGRIIRAYTGGWVQVEIDEHGGDYTFHPKQIRRLKKRELRRAWLPKTPDDLPKCHVREGHEQELFAWLFASATGDGHVEFIEVKRK